MRARRTRSGRGLIDATAEAPRAPNTPVTQARLCRPRLQAEELAAAGQLLVVRRGSATSILTGVIQLFAFGSCSPVRGLVDVVIVGGSAPDDVRCCSPRWRAVSAGRIGLQLVQTRRWRLCRWMTPGIYVVGSIARSLPWRWPGRSCLPQVSPKSSRSSAPGPTPAITFTAGGAHNALSWGDPGRFRNGREHAGRPIMARSNNLGCWPRLIGASLLVI